MRTPTDRERITLDLGLVLGRDGRAAAERALAARERRLRLAAADAYVSLVPEGGGATITVPLRLAAAGARAAEEVRVPGYRVEPAPAPPYRPADVGRPFARLLWLLLDTYRDDGVARAWLAAPNRALGGRRPASLVKEGRPEVVADLIRAATGREAPSTPRPARPRRAPKRSEGGARAGVRSP